MEFRLSNLLVARNSKPSEGRQPTGGQTPRHFGQTARPFATKGRAVFLRPPAGAWGRYGWRLCGLATMASVQWGLGRDGPHAPTSGASALGGRGLPGTELGGLPTRAGGGRGGTGPMPQSPAHQPSGTGRDWPNAPKVRRISHRGRGMLGIELCGLGEKGGRGAGRDCQHTYGIPWRRRPTGLRSQILHACADRHAPPPARFCR
jgi:hypothetical protein